MSVLSVVGGIVWRLRLPSTIARLGRVVGGSLHRLFKLDVRLRSGKDLAHLDDTMLQEVFVQRMSRLQPVDERVHRDFFTTIGDFDWLALKEVDVRLEIVSLSHLDGE